MRGFLFSIITVTAFTILVPFNGLTRDDSQASDIPIGVFLSLTGEHQTYGKEVLKGLELARDEINQKGGVKNHNLRLIVHDDQSKPFQVTRVVLELIREEKVPAIIGGAVSNLALAGAQICQREKIPMITPFSTSPLITEVGPYIFRVSFDDRSQASVMARFVLNELGLNRAIVMRNVSHTYSIDLARYFEGAFTAGGGQILGVIDYDTSTVNFADLLQPLKKESERFAVYIPGYDIDTARIVRTLIQMKLLAIPVGADTWDSVQLLNLLGKDFVEGYYTTLYDIHIDTPENRAFVRRYRDKFGGDPTPDAVAGYEALQVLAKALEVAPNLDPASIRRALTQVKFIGPVGPVQLNEDGNSRRDVVIIKIEKGQRRLLRVYGQESGSQ